VINLSLSDASDVVSGSILGDDNRFTGVSTDTRKLSEGQLFVAIAGDHYDGHDMLGEARNKGAVGALVNKFIKGSCLPQIKVSDTSLALGELASYWRKKFSVPIVAVTGSAGKTTVKNMLASIFKKLGPVLSTPANMNNEIGLPLTLFMLSSEIKSVVLEMGATKRGDIRYLAGVAEPNVGVLTMCSPAHLTGFGTLEAIAETKGELITSLPESGIAILNGDDKYFRYWKNLSGSRKSFIFGSGRDVYSKNSGFSSSGSNFLLGVGAEEKKVTLGHLGKHNVSNALAAAAAAKAIGVSIEDIVIGLSECTPTEGRLYPVQGRNRLNILDDTYNANPAALVAALEVLKNQVGSKWAVIGDMKELGKFSDNYHREAGEKINDAGVERLFTIGEKAALVGQVFKGTCEHFEDGEILIRRILEISKASELDISLLVKGSRSMQLETVVNALANPEVV